MEELLWDEIQIETVQAVHRLEQRVAQSFDQLVTKVDAQEAQILCLRLLEQATRSARQDRRRMMAHAVAGVFAPDLDSEMKARAERVLEQLEPRDVAQLRTVLDDTADDYELSSVCKGALVAAGCVVPAARWGSSTEGRSPTALVSPREVTEVGLAVVAFVTDWREEEPHGK